MSRISTLHTYQPFQKNKSPGFDLITYEVAMHLPRKTLILLKLNFNAILRLSYSPLQWKFSITVVIPKPSKPPDSPTSYTSISLLSFFSKVLEKLILKRITPIISYSGIIQNTQFGYRNFHSTTHQIHRITDTISSSLEKKQYCTADFLALPRLFIGCDMPGSFLS